MLVNPPQLTFETLQAAFKLIVSAETKKYQELLSPLDPTLNQYFPSHYWKKPGCFSPQLLHIFLTIKLNSLAKIEGLLPEKQKYHYHQLCKILANPIQNVSVLESQSSLMKQILEKEGASDFSSPVMKSIFLEGNCLAASILFMATNESLRLLYLHEVSCALSFQVFDGRSNAFIPIVHQQKNHSGQLLFANQINDLILFENKTSELGQMRSKEHSRVQDAYSTRCSPQIAGVSYEILTECIEFLNHEVNQYQLGYIPVDKEFFISTHSDQRSTQLFDYLAISLHQVSSVSFVRSQRILNKLINRIPPQINQKIQSHQFLHEVLEAVSARFIQNKNLCSPVSADSIPKNNYLNDVQNSGYMIYNKYQSMWRNMRLILITQILLSTFALKELKGHYQQKLTPVLQKIYLENVERFSGLEGKSIKEVLEEMERYTTGIEDEQMKKIMKHLAVERPHQHH